MIAEQKRGDHRAEDIAGAYRDFAESLRSVRQLARGEDLRGLSQECERLSRLGDELGRLPRDPVLDDQDRRLIECLQLEARCELIATLEFLSALSNHTRSLLGVLAGTCIGTYDGGRRQPGCGREVMAR